MWYLLLIMYKTRRCLYIILLEKLKKLFEYFSCLEMLSSSIIMESKQEKNI